MATIAKTVIVDGTDMEVYGMVWRTRIGWTGTSDATITVHPLPGGEKELFQDKRHRKGRHVSISGHVVATSNSELLTFIDQILERMSVTTIALSFSDDETRSLNCLVRKMDVTPMAPAATAIVAAYRLELFAPDPRKYDSTTQSKGLGVDCPLGTGRVRPVITLNGASTNPTITLKDHAGVTISSFTMTGTITIGNTWTIDSENGVIKENAVSAVDKFSGTLPVLDPKDADFDAGTFPDFTLTSGTVASITVVYQKAYK